MACSGLLYAEATVGFMDSSWTLSARCAVKQKKQPPADRLRSRSLGGSCHQRRYFLRQTVERRILSCHGDLQGLETIFSGDPRRPVIQNAVNEVTDLNDVSIGKRRKKMVGQRPYASAGSHKCHRCLV